MIFNPRPYQPLAINHIVQNKRCALWAGMGLGKGVSTLTAIESLSLTEDVYPALVLGPLRVARKVWIEEVAKWTHLNHLSVSTIIGNESERKAGLNKKADIYCINYENLPWLMEQLAGKEWPFKVIIADESTKLKGFRGGFQTSTKGKVFIRAGGGKRTSALAKVAHKSKRFIELTGTPASNGLIDIWGQMWFIDGGKRLGSSFGAFESRWFETVQNGSPFGMLVPREGAQDEIQAIVADVCLSINATDWFDLKEPIHTAIYVDLPKPAMGKYREMERELFTIIKGDPVEAANAASRSMKCLQLANGAAYINEDNKEWHVTHDEKLDALEDIIEESGGMPVLVAYNFKSDLARLQKRFPKGRALVTTKDEDDFKAGKVPILFAHPASAGHGIDGFQTATNIIVFFGLNWNLEEHAQIIERIGPVRQMQSNMNRPVFIYYILAKNTIDELVMTRLKTKRKVQDILLEAMTKGETNGNT